MPVAGSQTTRFEDAVKLAYHTGAAREEPLTSGEIGRLLADAPYAVVARAYATVDAWHWIPHVRSQWRRSRAGQIA